MTHSVFEVANTFIALAKKDNKELTHLKLQKLCYIAYGLSLAIYDKPLFKEEIYAWQYVPVIVDLYTSLKCYGKQDIKHLIKEYSSVTDVDDLSVVNAVWQKYKDTRAGHLVELTHKKGTPWEQTYNPTCKEIISDKVISEYYIEYITDDKRT